MSLINQIINELRRRMGCWKGFTSLTVYLGSISFFIGLVYLFLAEYGSITISDPSYLQVVGRTIFGAVILVELLVISFIGPSLTSGVISAKGERQTSDLLYTSPPSERAMVLRRLSSAAIYLLWFIFTAVPAQCLALFLGGVGLAELVISTLMLIVTAVFFCALGLFFSSSTEDTMTAIISSYATILLSFFLLLGLAFILILFGSVFSSNSTTFTDFMNTLMWILLSTNSFFAAIMSETILIKGQDVFLTTSEFIWGKTSFPLPSPWIIYTVFHIIISVILISLSVYFIGRHGNNKSNQ